MATLEEIFQQAAATKEEATALAQAIQTEEGARTYLAEHDCDATLEELAAFIEGKRGAEGELDENALEGIAGGISYWGNILDPSRRPFV